jgi:hypothetical protein
VPETFARDSIAWVIAYFFACHNGVTRNRWWASPDRGHANRSSDCVEYCVSLRFTRNLRQSRMQPSAHASGNPWCLRGLMSPRSSISKAGQQNPPSSRIIHQRSSPIPQSLSSNPWSWPNLAAPVLSDDSRATSANLPFLSYGRWRSRTGLRQSGGTSISEFGTLMEGSSLISSQCCEPVS